MEANWAPGSPSLKWRYTTLPLVLSPTSPGIHLHRRRCPRRTGRPEVVEGTAPAWDRPWRASLMVSKQSVRFRWQGLSELEMKLRPLLLLPPFFLPCFTYKQYPAVTEA